MHLHLKNSQNSPYEVASKDSSNMLLQLQNGSTFIRGLSSRPEVQHLSFLPPVYLFLWVQISDRPILFDISCLVSEANKLFIGLNCFVLLKGYRWIILWISRYLISECIIYLSRLLVWLVLIYAYGGEMGKEVYFRLMKARL